MHIEVWLVPSVAWMPKCTIFRLTTVSQTVSYTTAWSYRLRPIPITVGSFPLSSPCASVFVRGLTPGRTMDFWVSEFIRYSHKRQETHRIRLFNLLLAALFSTNTHIVVHRAGCSHVQTQIDVRHEKDSMNTKCYRQRIKYVRIMLKCWHMELDYKE